MVALTTGGASWRQGVSLQVLELNGHRSVGFQELQQLKVHPLQATLLGQQAENDDYANNLAVKFERHADSQIFLARPEGHGGPAIPELAPAFLYRAAHCTHPQGELPQNSLAYPGRPHRSESLILCTMPKNGYFFGSDQIPDDFANDLENLALVYGLNQPGARGMKVLQKKMLTLKLFAQGKLLRPKAQSIERQARGSRG